MNTQEENQPIMSSRMKEFLLKRFSEILGLLVVLFGVLIGIVLLTANSQDPSFNTASGKDFQNLFGQWGANFSEALYLSFGISALFTSIAPIFWGINLIINKNIHNWKLRLFFLPIAIFGYSLSIQAIFGEYNYDVGGIAGIYLLKLINVYFQNISIPVYLSHEKIIGITGFIIFSLLYFWICLINFKFFNNFVKAISNSSIKYLLYTKKLLKFDKLIKKEKEIKTHNLKTKREPIFSKNKNGFEKEKNKNEIKKIKQEVFDFDNEYYKLPPLKLLASPSKNSNSLSSQALNDNSKILKQVLEDFKIYGTIEEVKHGPVVTRYGLNPAPGTKSQRVIALADDIARSMSALAVRVAVVPGQNIIGIELPNKERELVTLRQIFDDENWNQRMHNLPLALGKDIAGKPIIVDLAKMPHLLVAGTTGSGKSVGINGMILSLLYKFSPEDCRFIMIDPKMLELSVYEGIPHLLSPVVTDPSKAIVALKWTVREMETRYRNMAKLGVRNITGYNQKISDARDKGQTLTRKVQTGFDNETGKPVFEEEIFDMKHIPFIVVIIDEVADLMLVAGKEIEAAVQRLAQMARAAGIHVIMATQRPSVDVITGTIKANFPTRISFQVTSKIDSRTILNEHGAEQLLGRGDMLYMEPGGRIIRIHGPFVEDHEVELVTKFLRQQGEPEYDENVTLEEDIENNDDFKGNTLPNQTSDPLYDEAIKLIIREQKASTSFVQRHLKIGYNRAATIIEKMEKEGIISSANHVGKREVLVQNENL